LPAHRQRAAVREFDRGIVHAQFPAVEPDHVARAGELDRDLDVTAERGFIRVHGELDVVGRRSHVRGQLAGRHLGRGGFVAGSRGAAAGERQRKQETTEGKTSHRYSPYLNTVTVTTAER